MSLNYSEEGSHPDELLEAYSLDALDEDEASLVEGHLEVCPQCETTVYQLLRTAAGLASLVTTESPPAELRSRVMAALPSYQVDADVPHRSPVAASARMSTTPWVLPLAAVLVIGLFSVSLIMNLRVTSRVDQLSNENSTVTAQLGQTSAQTQQLQLENSALLARLEQATERDVELVNAMRQMQVASFLSLRPDAQPLILEPLSRSDTAQGVLLVADNGQRAVLMVTNMKQPSASRTYNVWLVRDGSRIPVGKVHVDDNGWGALDVTPPEPVFMFDWVNLTTDEQIGGVSSGQRMVLRSKIPSLDDPR